MKIRSGFVSNSSSSSFICDVSGYTTSGWDMGLTEAGMFECENDHVFLEKYLVKDSKELEDISKEKWDEDYIYEYRYSVPSSFCPICTFGAVSDEDLIDYLQKTTGKGREDILEEIKKEFDSYEGFKKYIS